MKGSVGIITSDRRLWQRVRLLLLGEYEVVMLEGAENADDFCALLQCIDEYPELTPGAIPLGRGLVSGEGGLRLPLSHEELLALLEGEGRESSLTLLSERACIIGQERVELTEVEYRLLRELMREGGFVSREELCRRVWGGGAELGVVNVYIHYLRRKLEARGERVILSSRLEGYALDERYRRQYAKDN